MSEKEFKMREPTKEEQKQIDDYINSISRPITPRIYMVIFMEKCEQKRKKSNLMYRHFVTRKSAENFCDELIEKGYMADWSEVKVYE